MLNPEFAPDSATTRPAGVPAAGGAAPTFRAFTDRDAPMLRSSILLADTDEWHQTHDRVRLFRNGDVHYAIAEITIAGAVHPAIRSLVPWADSMPGCAVMLTLTTDQAEQLIEKLR